MTTLWILNIVLVFVVSVLSLVLLVVVRQIGILHERIAPLGALSTRGGPAIGSRVESRTWPRIDGGDFALPSATGGHVLLFFVSPKCPVCKKLIPAIKKLQKSESPELEIVLASDGHKVEHQKFVNEYGLTQFPYVLSHELGMMFRVAALPFAVIVDPSGTIRSKGLVNSREQLESLLTASELGYPTLDRFLAARNKPTEMVR